MPPLEETTGLRMTWASLKLLDMSFLGLYGLRNGPR